MRMRAKGHSQMLTCVAVLEARYGGQVEVIN